MLFLTESLFGENRKNSQFFRLWIEIINMSEKESMSDKHPDTEISHAEETSSSNGSNLADIDQHPAIFKLNMDCLHKLFDWFSLSELIPIAKTCQRFHQAAGDYFRSNYVSTEIISKDGHIYTLFRNIDIFLKFISRISTNCNNLQLNHLIGDTCKSLRHIRLSGILLEDRIECIKEILMRVKTVDLVECPNREEIYNIFLKYCTSMTSLSIKRSYKLRNKSIIIGSSNEWLHRKYPTLQHFELTELYELPENELRIFFERNPNVQTFTIDSNSLWENRQSIISSEIKLNKLAIEFMNEEFADEIIQLLNELYVVGFYKYLHVYSSRISQEYLDKIFLSLFYNSVEMLRGRLKEINVLLENVTILSFPGFYWREPIDTTNLYKNLPNLERIFFEEAKTEHIFPFICGSLKLKIIKIKRFHGGVHYVNGFIDLVTFNKERGKLLDATKIILYVDNHFVLSSKWSNQPIKYKSIELRQFGAFDWTELNSDYRDKHIRYYS